MQERDAQVTKKLMVIETASQRVPMNSCRNGQPYRGSPLDTQTSGMVCYKEDTRHDSTHWEL